VLMSLLAKVRSLVAIWSSRGVAQSLPLHAPIWDLVVGPSVLGQMDFVAYETPWITATFSPTPEFQKWVPLIKWRELEDVTEDDGDEAEAVPPEGELLLTEAHAAGGLVAVERGDSSAPKRNLFQFTDDFKFVNFR